MGFTHLIAVFLYSFCADDLRSVVPETVKVALFVDDVSLMCSHHNKLVADKELQRAAAAVVHWSKWSSMPIGAK